MWVNSENVFGKMNLFILAESRPYYRFIYKPVSIKKQKKKVIGKLNYNPADSILKWIWFSDVPYAIG